MLEEGDRRTLLKAARDAIKKAVTGEDLGHTPDERLTDSLAKPCGAFVTLTEQGGLRGCVGFVEAERSLYDTVRAAARAAALEDTRFAPVTASELDEIKVEISVLTPPEPVSSHDEIQLSKHGIIMSKEGRRALFLPKVARLQGWDIETTLKHLSVKAGLAPDDWREGARFEVFEAISFSESD